LLSEITIFLVFYTCRRNVLVYIGLSRPSIVKTIAIEILLARRLVALRLLKPRSKNHAKYDLNFYFIENIMNIVGYEFVSESYGRFYENFYQSFCNCLHNSFLDCEFRDDFFTFVRGWHNRRATADGWKHLNLVNVHSTETSLWIRDPLISPFNVGQSFTLPPFNLGDIYELNRRHGKALEKKEDIEARQLERLDHPNIVTVHDVFQTHNNICIVMNHIEGRALAELLDGRGRLDLHEAIPIISDILMALDYAHRQGIVHRDIKATNVLLDEAQRAHLIDFGLAMTVGEERRTRVGVMLGTPLYMSPEMITQPRTVDHRSDVYSVGCLLYEMLTGRPPFVQGLNGVESTDFAVKLAHVEERPVSPQSLVPSIPQGVSDVIMLSLQKEPNNRMAGCAEFRRMLLEATIDSDTLTHPARARRDSPWAKIAMWVTFVTCAIVILWFVLSR
jgi:serine/threonine-protein kinase